MQPLVSVIVPVYGVEDYLARCVESLLAQSLSEIEIILVDDGSPDNCGAICDSYAWKDPRIVVIHKENGGLASARNAGIAKASGEYLGFVDSDDWVDSEMFKLLYDSAKQIDADLAVCDYAIIATKITVIKGNKGSTKIDQMLLNGVKPIACNKLYRRSKGLHFYEDLRFAEDRPTTIPFLSRSNAVAYVPKPLYFYYQRPGSIANSYSTKLHYTDDIRSMQLMLQDCDPKYRKQCVKYCTDIITWTVDNKARRSCRADMIEFLQSMAPDLVRNQDLLKNKSVASLLAAETTPKTLVSTDFGQELSEFVRDTCTSSWTAFQPLETIVLHADHWDLTSLPDCVQRAAKRGECGFVADYYRLRYVYEHGGIALRGNVKMNQLPGEVRANRSFFGYRDRERITDAVFGSVANAEILAEILKTYEHDGVLNDGTEWPLADRIESVLVRHGLKEGSGRVQKLGQTVMVYCCDVLSLRLNGSSVFQEVSDEVLAAEEKGLRVIPESMIMTVFDNRPAVSNAAEPQKIKELQNEIDRLKNSKSWKWTRWLRKLMNLFRKNKYSEAEIV